MRVQIWAEAGVEEAVREGECLSFEFEETSSHEGTIHVVIVIVEQSNRINNSVNSRNVK